MLAKRMIEKREASRLNPLTLKHERSEERKGVVLPAAHAADVPRPRGAGKTEFSTSRECERTK